MARLFCGPDDSAWISERYDTPAQAVLTLREAIRRDATRVLFRCLSEDFKRTSGIKGIINFEVFWSRLQDQFAGVHLLGYAELSEPETLGDGRVRYELSYAGYVFEALLRRQAYWEVRDREGNEDGRYDGLGAIAELTFDDLDGTTAVRIALPPAYLPEFALEDVTQAGIGHNWKLDQLEPVERERTRRAGDDYWDY